MGYLSFFEKLLVPNYVKPHHILSAILEFDPERCLGCNVCVKICPARALHPGEKTEGSKRTSPKVIEMFPGIPMCMACGDCVAICPEDAIELVEFIQFKKFFRYLDRGAPEFPRKF